MGHSDAVLSPCPSAPGITPVDLRPLAARLGHGNLFAESAFLLADEARHSSADFVGMCSASYDAKWPGAPHLFDLPGVARRLDKAHAAGEELLVPAEWMPSAEHHHPGSARSSIGWRRRSVSNRLPTVVHRGPTRSSVTATSSCGSKRCSRRCSRRRSTGTAPTYRSPIDARTAGAFRSPATDAGLVTATLATSANASRGSSSPRGRK